MKDLTLDLYSGVARLPDGKAQAVRFIGSGKYTHAYQSVNHENRVYLYVQHGDLSKDILSHVDRKNNKHIPLMHYLGPMEDGKIDVYQTRYYIIPVTRKYATPETLRYVRELRKAHARACSEFPGNIIAKRQCIDFNYHIAEYADVPGKLKEALCLITESAQDWGEHYLFDDFHKGNLGLDSQGRLVLVDAMFDAEALQKERGNKI